MIGGDSWAADDWSPNVPRSPPSYEWRDDWSGDWRPTILAVPSVDGLRDLTGKRVQINSRDRVSLWHPADEPSIRDGFGSTTTT